MATKKAAAKRTTPPKVSPMKGTPVGAWVTANAKGWQAEVVDHLLDLVHRTAPDASLSIKWNQPVFELEGPLAFIRTAKAHVTLGFWRGSELKDPKKLLEGSGTRMAHVKIDGPEALLDMDKALRAFITAAVKLNEQKGDPTKRAKKERQSSSTRVIATRGSRR